MNCWTFDKVCNPVTLSTELKGAGVSASIQSSPSRTIISAEDADEASVRAVVAAHVLTPLTFGRRRLAGK